jgi:acetyltransferase-like isoleucine patch superfamily enzyme
MTRLRRMWGDGWAVVRARWYLRRADTLGSRVRLRGRPVVVNDGRLIVGDRVQLVSTVATLELATAEGGTIEIGSRTLVNYGTAISAGELVRIGPRCLIGTHVIMMDNDFHRIEPDRRLARPDSRPILIGENVWIGARCIIMGGVHIGDDSVIGAGSVVTRDIPSRSVAAGNPARVLRSL